MNGYAKLSDLVSEDDARSEEGCAELGGSVTVRWRVWLRRQAPSRWRLELRCDDAAGSRLVSLGYYDRRPEALAAQRAVLADPAAYWREPAKRGPKPRDVLWDVGRQQLAGGVRLRLGRHDRGGLRRSCAVVVCATEAEVEEWTRRIKADPAAYWREPVHSRATESKRRAAARRVEAQAEARRAAAPPKPVRCVRQPDGRWLLGCLLHTAASAMPCPVCARAAAETEAALERALTTERMAVMKRRAA